MFRITESEKEGNEPPFQPPSLKTFLLSAISSKQEIAFSPKWAFYIANTTRGRRNADGGRSTIEADGRVQFE
jgi:hypothetical protein